MAWWSPRTAIHRRPTALGVGRFGLAIGSGIQWWLAFYTNSAKASVLLLAGERYGRGDAAQRCPR